MRELKIFLASSNELAYERDVFADFIRTLNNILRREKIYILLLRWENFDSSLTTARTQDEYNKAIKGCDLFASIFHTRAGKYTIEEFETAYLQFQKTGRPKIFTLFKALGNSCHMDESLKIFLSRLTNEFGESHTVFACNDKLKLEILLAVRREIAVLCPNASLGLGIKGPNVYLNGNVIIHSENADAFSICRPPFQNI